MIVLKAIADAFEMPVTDLLPAEGARSAAMSSIAEMLGRLAAKRMARDRRR